MCIIDEALPNSSNARDHQQMHMNWQDARNYAMLFKQWQVEIEKLLMIDVQQHL